MIYSTLLSIAIFQGLVLGLVILRSSLFNSSANKYLSYLLFTLSIILLNHVFEIENAFADYPLLRFVDHIEWVFLIPSFLFLFVRDRFSEPLAGRKKIICFIPFAYSAVLAITYDLDHIAGVYSIPDLGIAIFEALGLVHFILAVVFIPILTIYCFLLLGHLKDSKEKSWVMSVLVLVASLLFSWLIACLVGLFFQYDISSIMNLLAFLVTIMIHWIAYRGIYKYELAIDKDAIYNFLNKDKVNGSFQFADVEESEDCKGVITADNLYFQNLELLCKEQHIYTDSTLNREKVAEKLGISAGYVSQIINTITGDNFANYINQYRVEAVKEMMLNCEYENYNLLSLGLESGFTSKTTFFKAFKKITGQTPNEYKNAFK